MMVAANFDSCVQSVLTHEGLYVDHPADPGGATNFGITLATLQTWRKRAVTKADVAALTRSEAIAIYRANYWNAVAGGSLPSGIDYVAFDVAVNSGPARALRLLATALGTALASALLLARAAKDSRDPLALIRSVCAGRLAFVRGLRNFATFGRGWMKRYHEVEAKAIAMALQAQGQSGSDVARQLDREASLSREQAQREAGGVAGSVIVSGGAATPILADPSA